MINKDMFNREYIYNFLAKKEKCIIFDIGANDGQSILEFKQKIPNASIYAFEPNFECSDKLVAISKMFDNININMLGIGTNKTTSKLYKYSYSPINSFLEIDKNSVAVKIESHKKINQGIEDKCDVQECDIIDLDLYCMINNIDHIHFIKIDTQGFENEVLKGAQAMLSHSKIDIILTEIIFDDIYGGGEFIFGT